MAYSPSQQQQQPITAGYVPFTYNQMGDHLSNERHWPPYHPISNMTQAEMDLRAARGVYEHFHVPWNTNNRFLSTFNQADLAACRDIPRRAPPPNDPPGLIPPSSLRPSTSDGVSGQHYEQLAQGMEGQVRPQTASPQAIKKRMVRERMKQLEYAEAQKWLMATQTGVPCYTTSAKVSADLERCAPLDRPLPEPDAWRESRVQTYALLPAEPGWAEGGVRPFHQDYRHYKYYGFAGRGAKSSWAHNPKYKAIYQEVIRDAADANPAAILSGAAEAPPLESSIGGPRRPLTPKERELVSQFPEHTYSAESLVSPSRTGASPAGRPTSASPRLQHQARSPGTPTKSTLSPSAEVMEPYFEKVDLRDNKPTSPQASPRHSPTVAKVATYRQPVPSPLTLTENTSPQHGSQSPFHQRYAHYKQFGFGGKGATSSWARNPKYAQL